MWCCRHQNQLHPERPLRPAPVASMLKPDAPRSDAGSGPRRRGLIYVRNLRREIRQWH